MENNNSYAHNLIQKIAQYYYFFKKQCEQIILDVLCLLIALSLLLEGEHRKNNLIVCCKVYKDYENWPTVTFCVIQNALVYHVTVTILAMFWRNYSTFLHEEEAQRNMKLTFIAF